MALMTISDLTKTYVGGMNALQGINMEIEPGRIIGLLGPNGSGKTTLLKVIAGLLQPDDGDIVYPGGAKRGIESKKTVSLMPDTMSFPGWMKVKDAFDLWRDQYPDYEREQADSMIQLLELDPNMLIKRMSKGMQERVNLALTFSRKTSLYLLDEPLGGIDPLGKMKVLESILAMPLEQSSIVISTHLVKDVETVFDSFFLISRGQIVYRGDCEEIREQSGKTAEQVYLEVFSGVGTV